jgi:hypothetical protein
MSESGFDGVVLMVIGRLLWIMTTFDMVAVVVVVNREVTKEAWELGCYLVGRCGVMLVAWGFRCGCLSWLRSWQ